MTEVYSLEMPRGGLAIFHIDGNTNNICGSSGQVGNFSGNIASLAEECFMDPSCDSFNSDGLLKHTIPLVKISGTIGLTILTKEPMLMS